MLVIPAIDLRQGKCVRLTQGRKAAATLYDRDPVAVAKDFARDGARMLHIVDLDGAFLESNSRNRQVLSNILRAVDVPIQFGGGLRSHKDVLDVCRLGVARVVLGTIAVEAPETLRKLVRQLGPQRVIVGVDARAGRVTTRGWETQESLEALTHCLRVAQLGIERVVYTDVARDGMLQGVDIHDALMIARASGLKVTASGGVSSLKDLERLKCVGECGVDSVIVGKALYEGRFTFAEAVKLMNHSA